jgi:hypothetical protein
MKKKTLIIFIVLAIVLSIISFSFIKKTKLSFAQNEYSIGTPVFKNIKLNDIKTIKIIKPDSTTITLQKQSNIWVVKTLYDYPADTNKLSGLLQETADLKIIQNVQKTSQAYIKLNLIQPNNSAKENKAVEIQFYNRKETLLYSLLIGKKRFETDVRNMAQIPVGRYVRVPSQKNIILTDELFDDINFKANDWLYNRDLSISNIKSIKLAKKSETEWVLIRDTAKDNFNLKGTPEYTVLNKQKIDAIINSINNLKFNSIADNKLSPDKTGLDTPVTLTVSTFNGVKYELLIGNVYENNRYVKCKVIADKKTLTKKQLNQQSLFSKWVYLINLNRIDPLLSSKDSILKQENKKRAPSGIYSQPIS